ncbi:uncharacterized protein LOC124848121, partial [Vigna umbellata]|uniref:uncharacterized protein LOC124848121 n=1 Tax=Vigna umbellata TaxID=87088 RepID=UPI001F5EC84C
MKASQSRQKSYADQRRKPLEFARRSVFLRVTPYTGVGRAIRARENVPPKYSLRKYVARSDSCVEVEDVQVREDLSVEVQPVRVEEHQTKRLKARQSDCQVIWDERTARLHGNGGRDAE